MVAHFIVDTTPPNTFDLVSNITNPTNNQTPTIEFSTTDMTSGIDHYEISVDGSSYMPVQSPYTLSVLDHGTHAVKVRAYDKAGWYTDSSLQIEIDIVPPKDLIDYNIISGLSGNRLVWNGQDDDIDYYEIERQPSFSQGVLTCQSNTYVDQNAIQAERYSYRVRAIDYAGNRGPYSDWRVIRTGFETGMYKQGTSLVLEYEGARVAVPSSGIPADVYKIAVTAVESGDLESGTANAFTGKIFDLNMLTEEGQIVQAEDIDQPVLVSLDYSTENLPEGYDEDNIGAYYFDEFWGRWFKIENAVIDKEHKQIHYVTKHFSYHTTQYSNTPGLTQAETNDVGANPFRSATYHGDLKISTQGGSVSTHANDYSLPGPDGFDLNISRYYNSSLSITDTRNQIDPGELQYTDLMNLGDYIYSMGRGWRMDIPYIRDAGRELQIVLPGGSIQSIWNMEIVSETTDNTGTRTLTLESHSGSDHFSLKIRQQKKADPWEVFYTGGLVSLHRPWHLQGAELTLKNGKKFTFRSDGLLRKITSPDGENQITLAYAMDQYLQGSWFQYLSEKLELIPESESVTLIEITDAFGRTIEINYTERSGFPYITLIRHELSGEGNSITLDYSIDKSGLLKSFTDPVGRTWNYDNKEINYEVVPMTVPIAFSELDYDQKQYVERKLSGETQVEEKKVTVLEGLDGPGSGFVDISYHKYDGEYGMRLRADTATVYTDGTKEAKKSEVSYAFYENMTIEDNGRRKTYYYFEGYRSKTKRWYEFEEEQDVDNDNYGYYESYYDSEESYEDGYSDGFDAGANDVVANIENGVVFEPLEKCPVDSSNSDAEYGKGWDEGYVNGWNSLPLNNEAFKAGYEEGKGDYNSGGLRAPNPDDSSTSYFNIYIEGYEKGWNYAEYKDNYEKSYTSAETINNEFYLFPPQVNDENEVINNAEEAGLSKGLADLLNDVHQTNFSLDDDENPYFYSANNGQNDNNSSTYADGDTVELEEYETVPSKRLKKIIYRDYSSRDTDFVTIQWQYLDSNPVRPYIINTQKGDERHSKVFIYDGWGNVTKYTDITGTKQTGDLYVTNKYVVTNTYHDPSNDSAISVPRHDLIRNSITANYLPHAGSLDDAALSGSIADRVISNETINSEITYNYNSAGKVTSLTTGAAGDDKSDLVTSYSYKDNGRLKKITSPGSQTTEFTYDADGYYISEINVTNDSITENENNKIIVRKFEVDQQTGRTTKVYIPNYDAASDQFIKYRYDDIGRVVEIIGLNTNSDEGRSGETGRPGVRYSYDETSVTVRYGEYSGGAVSSFNENSDKTVTYNYNSAGQLEEILRQTAVFNPASDTTTINDVKVSYQYNQWNQLAAVIKPSGHSGSEVSMDHATLYDYDSLGRLESVYHPGQGGKTDRDKVRYEYDYQTMVLRHYNEEDHYGDIEYDILGRVISKTTYEQTDGTPQALKTHFFYDSLGNLVITKNHRGSVVRRHYNKLYQLVTITGPAAEVCETTALDNEIAVTNSTDSLVVAYSYNDDGQVSSVETMPGSNNEHARSVNYNYDEIGRLRHIEKIAANADVSSLEYTFEMNASGSITKTVDPSGNSVLYTYSDRGKLIETVDSKGTKTTYTYNLDGSIKSITEQYASDIKTVSSTTFYEYYDTGQLKSIIMPVLDTTSAAGTTPTITFFYDTNGNIIKKTNVDDTYSIYSYDAYRNWLTDVTSYDSNGTDSYTTSYSYYSDGRLMSANPPGGETNDIIRYYYDSLNRTRKVVYAEGNTMNYEYNGLAGTVTSYISTESSESRLNETTYNYDSIGRLESVDIPGNRTVTMKYDVFGEMTHQNDINDKTWLYAYDNYGRLAAEEDPLGNVLNYDYTDDGLLQATEDRTGTSFNYEYNDYNQLTGISAAKGSEADQETQKISYSYDVLGNVKSITEGGYAINYNLDTNGNHTPDIYGRTLSKQVSFAQEKSLRVDYEYDSNGRMSSIVYPDSVDVPYSYDAFGRLESVGISPDNTGDTINQAYIPEAGIAYNDRGMLESVEAGNGVKKVFDYDNNGRLSELDYLNGDASFKKYSYDYDAANNLTSIQVTTASGDDGDFKTVTNEYSYDEANRLEKAILSGEFIVDVKAKANQLVARVDDHFGNKSLAAAGTPINEMTRTVSASDGSSDEVDVICLDYSAGSIGVDLRAEYPIIRFELTDDYIEKSGLESRIDADQFRLFYSSDNTVWTELSETDFEVFVPDAIGTMTNIHELDEASIQNISKVEFRLIDAVVAQYIKIKTDYDERSAGFRAIDNATFANKPEDLIRITYIVPNRTEEYTYDTAGNRTSVDIGYTGNGRIHDGYGNDYFYYEDSLRMVTDGEWVYEYDAEGRTVAKGSHFIVNDGSYAVDGYTSWSSCSNEFDSSGEKCLTIDHTKGQSWEYTYDLFGRMTEATSYTGSTEKDSVTYGYTPDGLRFKRTYKNDTEYYLYGPGGNLLYTETSNHEAARYVYALGQIFAAEYTEDTTNDEETYSRYYLHTNHQGSVIDVTNALGESVFSTEYTPFGETHNPDDMNNKFAFYTGKQYDPVTGLYYYNARWYDPNTGRFTTSDPIKDGLNWYAYCANNPVNYVDPSGLRWQRYGDGSYRALSENDTIYQMYERLGYETWQEMAETHGISDWYNDDASWANTPGADIANIQFHEKEEAPSEEAGNSDSGDSGSTGSSSSGSSSSSGERQAEVNEDGVVTGWANFGTFDGGNGPDGSAQAEAAEARLAEKAKQEQAKRQTSQAAEERSGSLGGGEEEFGNTLSIDRKKAIEEGLLVKFNVQSNPKASGEKPLHELDG